MHRTARTWRSTAIRAGLRRRRRGGRLVHRRPRRRAGDALTDAGVDHTVEFYPARPRLRRSRQSDASTRRSDPPLDRRSNRLFAATLSALNEAHVSCSDQVRRRPCDAGGADHVRPIWQAANMAWLVSDARVLASAEVADAGAARGRGLLERDGFEGAFVIEPCRWIHTIGMRFPIDVAYVDADGVVVKTIQMHRHRVGIPVRPAPGRSSRPRPARSPAGVCTSATSSRSAVTTRTARASADA